MSQPDPHHIDASAFGERIEISDTWLFSPNDDPAFASPTFDDRFWPVISTRRGLSTYGFHDLGTCWYRMHVHLPSFAQNVLLANAGHMSPYVDGQELEAPPALPLGIAADQEYPELSGQLGTGARMVLMSDGVVEARSKTRELYGFERLNGLTLKPAQEIAATAQAFGQDDDITVLTLACRS